MRLNRTSIACPRCRSKQKFTLQRRYKEDSEVFTVYVQCKMCKKEIILEDSTIELEKLKKVILRLERSAKVKSLSQSSLNLLSDSRKRLYNIKAALDNNDNKKG